MLRSLAAYLEDAKDASDEILTMTRGYDEAGYLRSRTTQLAVERCYQIIGEVLVQLRDRDPARFRRIDNASQIIRFRNLLVHAYFNLDHITVWETITLHLPRFRSQAAELLAEIVGPDDLQQ